MSDTVIEKQTNRVITHKNELKFKLKEGSHECHAYVQFLVIPATSNSVTSLSADLTHS